MYFKIQRYVSCVASNMNPPFSTPSFVSWPLMPISSCLPENAGCCWMCHTRICSTKLRFRDWVQLAQISQGPLCQITWHSLRPAAIIQASDRELVSSNGRSNTTLGHCGAPCPKKQKCVCVCDVFVYCHDEANTLHLYYLTALIVLCNCDVTGSCTTKRSD